MYANSREALPANLHLWDTPATQTAILETKVWDIYPTNAIDGSDTISFVIPGTTKYMLEKVELISEIRVLNNDLTNPAANNDLSTAPHLAAALYRNVDVSIGGVSLTQSFDNSYAMSKFWSDMLHNRHGVYPFLAQKEGFIPDSVLSKADSENVVYFPADANTTATNKNGAHRATRIAQGRKVHLVSDFNVSLFKQDKLLPTELDIRVNLTKNYSEFILLSAATKTEKVVFDSVILRCTFQRPTDVILNLLNERLSKENARFHADKTVLTFHPIAQGALELTIQNLFNGRLPYYFLVGVQDRAALARDRTKNPFSLYPLKKVQLYTNGIEFFPKAIEQSAHDNTFMWDMLLNQSGYIHQGDTMLYDRYDCYPAIAFDLTQDKSVNAHGVNLSREGVARLTIGFEEETPANRVLMVLACYEQIVEVTKDRQVILV